MTSPIRRWRARADADATVASTTIAIIRWIDPLSKHQHQPGAIFIVLLPSRMGGADAVTCAGGRTYRTYVHTFRHLLLGVAAGWHVALRNSARGLI